MVHGMTKKKSHELGRRKTTVTAENEYRGPRVPQLAYSEVSLTPRRKIAITHVVPLL